MMRLSPVTKKGKVEVKIENGDREVAKRVRIAVGVLVRRMLLRVLREIVT